jgi:hypothetical protein
MTGPTEAVEPQEQNEETRDAFCDWLYWEQYELATPERERVVTAMRLALVLLPSNLDRWATESCRASQAKNAS